jgi:cytoskeletal protein CcmA (bactofilin family)
MSNPYDNTAKPGKTSVLGPTLKFKGELTAEEDLVIEGSFEGSIEHTSNLTIGESGRLNGTVSAEHVAVEGYVEGEIHGTQSVTIRETANINGNVRSPTVSLLEGATFNGNIDMTGKATEEPGDDAATTKTADPLAAAEEPVAEDAAPA